MIVRYRVEPVPLLGVARGAGGEAVGERWVERSFTKDGHAPSAPQRPSHRRVLQECDQRSVAAAQRSDTFTLRAAPGNDNSRCPRARRPGNHRVFGHAVAAASPRVLATGTAARNSRTVCRLGLSSRASQANSGGVEVTRIRASPRLRVLNSSAEFYMATYPHVKHLLVEKSKKILRDPPRGLRVRTLCG